MIRPLQVIRPLLRCRWEKNIVVKRRGYFKIPYRGAPNDSDADQNRARRNHELERRISLVSVTMTGQILGR